MQGQRIKWQSIRRTWNRFGKKVYLEQSTPKTAIDLMKKIKAVFDPNNILNPGKIC